jgi:hypothetical protein
VKSCINVNKKLKILEHLLGNASVTAENKSSTKNSPASCTTEPYQLEVFLVYHWGSVPAALRQGMKRKIRCDKPVIMFVQYAR